MEVDQFGTRTTPDQRRTTADHYGMASGADLVDDEDSCPHGNAELRWEAVQGLRCGREGFAGLPRETAAS